MRKSIGPLLAVSPVDGRYEKTTAPLSKHLSEFALMRARLTVECEYLPALSEIWGIHMRRLTTAEYEILDRMPHQFNARQATIIKKIETSGWGGFKRTNHDVKAVEYYMRHLLTQTSLRDCLEWIHFALTSEDVNNLSYAMMLHGAVEVLKQQLRPVLSWMDHWAKEYRDVAMLSRTHGQPASPTVLGKEIRNYASRLHRQLRQLDKYRMLVKLNGASGNYNAHMAAYPTVNWMSFTRAFVKRLNRKFGYNFKVNPHTTQIEPHDTYSELFAILHRINVIITDFCQDVWRYVSDEWFVQVPAEGEVGSSVMPNKVNPIDVENAEGNVGVANALFEFYNRTLPVSRLQRHLSDSTIIRTFGEALGHCLIGYHALNRGLGKIHPNRQQIHRDLDRRPEVLAEGYQTILRHAGHSDAYGLLKDLTRGREITLDDLHAFANRLQIDEDTRAQLLALTPHNYTGLASFMASGIAA